MEMVCFYGFRAVASNFVVLSLFFGFTLRFRDDCASGPLIFLGVFVLFLCDFCHGNYRRIYNS